jgi:hypothetical protein
MSEDLIYFLAVFNRLMGLPEDTDAITSDDIVFLKTVVAKCQTAIGFIFYTLNGMDPSFAHQFEVNTRKAIRTLEKRVEEYMSGGETKGSKEKSAS